MRFIQEGGALSEKVEGRDNHLPDRLYHPTNQRNGLDRDCDCEFPERTKE